MIKAKPPAKSTVALLIHLRERRSTYRHLLGRGSNIFIVEYSYCDIMLPGFAVIINSWD